MNVSQHARMSEIYFSSQINRLALTETAPLGLSPITYRYYKTIARVAFDDHY